MKDSVNPSAIRSKKEITDALITLMQTIPFTEITVKQIVLEAKLERKTFYNNFSSKDDVLDAIINTAIQEYVITVTGSKEGPLNVIFDFCNRNRELLALLQKNNMLYLLLQRLNAVIPELNCLSELNENPFRVLIGDLEPDYLIAFNIGAIWNVIFKWVDRGMKDSPEYIKQTIEEYLKHLSPS